MNWEKLATFHFVELFGGTWWAVHSTVFIVVCFSWVIKLLKWSIEPSKNITISVLPCLFYFSNTIQQKWGIEPSRLTSVNFSMTAAWNSKPKFILSQNILAIFLEGKSMLFFTFVVIQAAVHFLRLFFQKHWTLSPQRMPKNPKFENFEVFQLGLLINWF